MPLLEVSEIHAYYGTIEALKGISLTVDEGEVVTLIGSNGAGKSTTLRSISGLTPARTGMIRFEGEDITRVPPTDRRLRDRALARGPPLLPAHDRAREPRPRRPSPPRARVARISSGSSRCSPAWPSASDRRRGRCPAASSRCWRSAGP